DRTEPARARRTRSISRRIVRAGRCHRKLFPSRQAELRAARQPGAALALARFPALAPRSGFPSTGLAGTRPLGARRRRRPYAPERAFGPGDDGIDLASEAG